MSVPDGSIQITIHEWDRVKRGHDRYEWLRRQHLRVVMELWRRALADNKPLDAFVDELRASEGEGSG